MQRRAEVGVMLEAGAESLEGQETVEIVVQRTGLSRADAESVMQREIFWAISHGPISFAVLFASALDLGFRLGLEEAGRMPSLNDVVPERPPRRSGGVVGAALAAGRHMRGWRP